MKLTTKGRYAVTAMLDISLHCKEKPVSLAEISERQDISLSYLEQLFSKLRRQGLVNSMRGPGGGYRLSRDPSKIAMSEIIMAVDENVDLSKCRGQGNCKQNERCLTHDLWMDLSHRIQSFLDDISLEEMMSRADVIEIAARQKKEKVIEMMPNNSVV
ncbi:MAG TPA: Fe-S cluster assembly transcriptional regulator IscR [Leucothrix mucor]|uniref:Fe-S cluster assembly transcriptional regulator IscR n=1 Tax=Leucothrix mucor TaxID=45248 RepID=A0A7V2SXK8_LEUMU|nr:Fe-S cluster assembly transcriptional regulator IscR [Leucothrix mucor]